MKNKLKFKLLTMVLELRKKSNFNFNSLKKIGEDYQTFNNDKNQNS